MNGQSLDLLDTRLSILTPEFMWFHHRLAGPIRRLEAYVVDVLLRALALVVLALGAVLLSVVSYGGLHQGAAGPLLVAYFVLDWGYGAFFETVWSGQTPGKRLVGLRVLTGDGRPIHGRQAVIRNLLRAADILPFLFLTGFASMLVTRRFQRLGDLAADTIVVLEESDDLPRSVREAEPEAVALAERLPSRFRASRDLRRALGVWVARRHRFPIGRRKELAEILAGPLRSRLGLEGFAAKAASDGDLLLCAVHRLANDADRAGLRARLDSDAARPPARPASGEGESGGIDDGSG